MNSHTNVSSAFQGSCETASQLLNGLFRNLSPTTDPLAALVGCFGRCVHFLSGWEKCVCVCVWPNTWVVSAGGKKCVR